MKFTIDTEVDSYENAMRTVLAAYGHLPEPSAPQMPPRLPADVVWQHPGYGGAIWTEEMLRTWARALTDTAALNLVWRVCCEPGLPGVHGQVLAEYVVPDLTRRAPGCASLIRPSPRSCWRNSPTTRCGHDCATTPIPQQRARRPSKRRRPGGRLAMGRRRHTGDSGHSCR